ncbi:metal-dependent transcriptional regulator [bacterium]|nr:metal-dependent transcriptional regulator [bacterium]
MHTHGNPKVSSSAEEYLLTLYRLESSGERAGSSQLAKMFGVKAPSVTGMLRRLSERGWVRYQRYRPPELTEEGRRVAVYLVRRHRLLETFLVRFLDYSWEEVHEEVQQLEHTVSDSLLNHIDRKLGHPNYDPHGDPIPDEHGNMPEHKLVPLTRLEEGSQAEVGRVDNRSRHLLTVLGEIGAFPGANVTRLAGTSNGKLSVRVGRREIQIDGDVARLIWVKPNRSGSAAS